MRPSRWVDFAEKIIYVLPMRMDLHCHTKYSHDNYFEPQELIEQTIKMNLDGVCIAEHFAMIPPWAMGLQGGNPVMDMRARASSSESTLRN